MTLRICTVTATSARASIIGDAIRSASWADGHVLVDLGMDDATLKAAQDAAEGRPVHVFPTRWIEEGWIEGVNDDSAEFRNEGLRAAELHGYDIACILDTDERMVLNGEDIRKALETGDTWNVRESLCTYTKARFIRLPAKRRYTGECHENYPNLGTDPVLERMRFTELPKSPEAQLASCRYILRKMDAALEREPDRLRSHLYRGEALRGLARPDDALRAYARAVCLPGDPEEAARAAWMAAVTLISRGLERKEAGDVPSARQDMTNAVARCAEGMVRHPGVPELPFYAAIASAHMGNAASALCWARMAAVHGMFKGDGASIVRMGTRYPPAHYDGPFEVMVAAYGALGDPGMEAKSKALADEAAKARLAQEVR